MVTDKLLWSRSFPCCKRRTETHKHSSCDCHIVQLPPDWKLSWHWRSLCFHHLTISLLSGDKSEALWLRRHRTAGLSAHVASLLSIHMYSSLPRKGPLLLRAEVLRVTLVSPTWWITTLSDGDLLLHSPPLLSNSWQTCTVGLVADSQSCLPRSGRWAEPWVTFQNHFCVFAWEQNQIPFPKDLQMVKTSFYHHHKSYSTLK